MENAFGILTQRFRIFQRRIQSKPENVDFIILATCILHNFIKDENVSHFNNDSKEPTILENISARGRSATQQAFSVREILKDFFNSDAGRVPWQNEKI